MARALAGRARFEDGLSDELRLHLDLLTEDLRRQGVPAAEARRRARLAFGNVDNVRADCREARGLRLVDELTQDVHYAFRMMRRAPGVTATAVITLALCLGANLTIFAGVNAVLLRPLPFHEPDRLVRVFNTYPLAGVADDGCSITNYYERRGQIAAFQAIAAIRPGTAIVGETGATAQEPVARVTADFFEALGVGPVLGRSFVDAELTPGRDGVAIVSDGFYRERLGGDPGILGRAIRVDGRPTTVVGVLPPEFHFLSSRARIYLPLASTPEQRGPANRHSGSSTQMIARLSAGAGLAEAQAEVDAHNAAVGGDGPETAAMLAAGFRTRVVPLRADHVAAIRPTLLLLQAGALLLLLIGAVNLVNLLLVRAVGRGMELAVRQALGARPSRIVRQVLVETTVLTLTGGAAGLALAAAGIRLLGVLGADRLPLGAGIGFDGAVVAAGVLGSLALGGAIGAPLVWQALRAHAPGEVTSRARGGTAGRRVQRLRHLFLVGQVALAFVLVAAAGLLAASLERAAGVAPGFQAERVLSGHLTVPASSYPTRGSLLDFADRLAGALRAQPGVSAVGIGTNVPLSGDTLMSAASVEGQQDAGGPPHATYAYSVSGDYFAALGIPVLEGRALTADDSRRAVRVAVVDEDFARRYGPDGRALGRHVYLGPRPEPPEEAYTVVGVVGAVKQASLTADEAPGAVFYPLGHRLGRGLFVVTRTTVAPEAFATTLGQVVRGIDPDLPVTDVRSMETRIADSLVALRSPALLALAFSLVAVVLTTVGTYGVLSSAVAERRREIGLRLALGAAPGDVGRLFGWMGFRLVAVGCAIGLAGAWAAGGAMQAVLFDVPALHPATLGATAALIATVAFVACLVPALRAPRTAPRDALAEP
ncbi:MAG: ADOP family duplicated permease [Vicinamibacterales bacterium]